MTDLRNEVHSPEPKEEEEIKGVQREHLPLGEHITLLVKYNVLYFTTHGEYFFERGVKLI